MNVNASLYEVHPTTVEIAYRVIDTTILLATAVLCASLLVKVILT
jgi:hypothetical protein